jgi:hypothetical protein
MGEMTAVEDESFFVSAARKLRMMRYIPAANSTLQEGLKRFPESLPLQV